MTEDKEKKTEHTMKVQGTFITFEGGEGAGKSTVVEELAAWIATSQGREVIVTREPGGIDIAEKIREIILHPKHRHMDDRTEALLYAAARRQHLMEKVVPALKAGKVVLCDRFIDSSLAYQGHARGIGIESILELNKFAVNEWMPTLTIYLDIPPEVGLKRIRSNLEREVNRLDMETLAFHERVREGYQLLVSRYPNRIRSINANRSLSYVLKEAKQAIIPYLR